MGGWDGPLRASGDTWGCFGLENGDIQWGGAVRVGYPGMPLLGAGNELVSEYRGGVWGTLWGVRAWRLRGTLPVPSKLRGWVGLRAGDGCTEKVFRGRAGRVFPLVDGRLGFPKPVGFVVAGSF